VQLEPGARQWLYQPSRTLCDHLALNYQSVPIYRKKHN
jgi:hypothetical protein